MLAMVLLTPYLSSCKGEKTIEKKPTVELPISDYSESEYLFDFTKGMNTVGSYIGSTNPDIEYERSDSGLVLKSNKSTIGSSAGKTSGFHLALGVDYEKEFSGSLIQVAVTTRALGADSMAVTYSTAEVGNSGWSSFELSDKFGTYVFEYRVPKLLNGGADFIGVRAIGGPIEIANIKVRILERN